MTSVTDASAFQCGDSDSDEIVSAADSLAVLQTAVDLRLCEPCLCDYSGDGKIGVDDALLILKRAVGIPAPAKCPACSEPLCGDSVVAPYLARPFTKLYVATCEVLDNDSPFSIAGSARDTRFRDVTGHVAAEVDAEGCYCLSDLAAGQARTFRRREPRYAVDADVVTTTSTWVTSSTDCLSPDCFWGITIHSDVPLVEVNVSVYGALCEFGVDRPLNAVDDGDSIIVDSQVREECDDGNTQDGDGCSSSCRIETP